MSEYRGGRTGGWYVRGLGGVCANGDVFWFLQSMHSFLVHALFSEDLACDICVNVCVQSKIADIVATTTSYCHFFSSSCTVREHRERERAVIAGTRPPFYCT